MKFSTVLQYEPELFPGLIYRMKQPKIVLLIFVSGKIVLTGAKVSSHFLYMLISLHLLLFPSFYTLFYRWERRRTLPLKTSILYWQSSEKFSNGMWLFFTMFKSNVHDRRLLLEMRFSCSVDKMRPIIWITAAHYVLLGTCGVGLGTGAFYC